jgi:hypothetical protein
MSIYTAPHRATSKRSLSRHTRIILTTSLLTSAILLTIATLPASAAAKFVTIQDVQDAINAALAPIQSTIASLQQQQANQATQLTNQQSAITDLQNTQATHTTQIGDLQTQQTNQAHQIANLQNSTGKQLIAYDANGQELGLVIGGVGGSGAMIYSPPLNEFIYIATNSYGENPSNNQGFIASGINFLVGRIYYKSSDCTGTPYGSTDYGFPTNQVFAFSPTENYTYHSSDAMVTTTTFSYRTSNQPTTCQPGITAITGWPLYPVTLPFPTPIAEPVQFKYQ